VDKYTLVRRIKRLHLTVFLDVLHTRDDSGEKLNFGEVTVSVVLRKRRSYKRVSNSE